MPKISAAVEDGAPQNSTTSTFAHQPADGTGKNHDGRSELSNPVIFPRASGESPRAYSAFMTYFQLGHARSLQNVADKLDENIDTVRRWSSKFDWRDRIHSFNAGLLQQQAEAEAAVRLEHAAEWASRLASLRREEWSAAQKLLSTVQCFLETCGEDQLQKMTLGQVGRALNISSKIGRLAISGADNAEKTAPQVSPVHSQLDEALKRLFSNGASPESSGDQSTQAG
jgi:hypothetical protein